MHLNAEHAPNLLQAVRAHYGVSFDALAAVLGVSASLLTMAATGRRELPATAYLRLQPLADGLPPPWNAAPPAEPVALPESPEPSPGPLPPPLPYAPDPAALRRRLRDGHHLLLRGARELAPLARRQAQGARLLAVLPAWAAALLPTDERAARWLPLLEAQARERLGPGPAAVLALGQARQAALRLEMSWLAAWLGKQKIR